MTFRVVRTNQYNQDLVLIHSTNGNHLKSPNEGSSIDHQVTIYLHAQNITMFPTNETCVWFENLHYVCFSCVWISCRLDMQNTVACDWIHCSLRMDYPTTGCTVALVWIDFVFALRLLPAGYHHRRNHLLNLSAKTKRCRIHLSKRHRFAIANFNSCASCRLLIVMTSLLTSSSLIQLLRFLSIADCDEITADIIIADIALALLVDC
ncbi:TMV resistance protein N-like [Dorcoceras hygrometricum]|uniref:TMV resistance protein N-like n=1 Tax=Dorcoceras hygrometricum TaxID=472368 RepID=A0A2Z7CV69_9LAMI|nr:TMV resistance protein N-like [Dorcoceras hygrometricum]